MAGGAGPSGTQSAHTPTPPLERVDPTGKYKGRRLVHQTAHTIAQPPKVLEQIARDADLARGLAEEEQAIGDGSIHAALEAFEEPLFELLTE